MNRELFLGFLGILVAILAGCKDGAKVSRAKEEQAYEEARREKERARAMAIIEKAINAHGGEQNLSRLQTGRIVSKMEGSVPVLGQTEIRVEDVFQPNRYKKITKGKSDGRDVDVTWVINGDQCWYREGKAEAKPFEHPVDLDKQHHPFSLFESLLNLGEEGLEVVPLGDRAVGTQVLSVIRVKDKDGPAIEYFFDIESGLLTRASQKKPLGNLNSGKLVSVLSIYSEPKVWSGLKLPRITNIYHDGKKTLQATVEEVQLVNEFPEDVFSKP
jgi:hypothetical protein